MQCQGSNSATTALWANILTTEPCAGPLRRLFGRPFFGTLSDCHIYSLPSNSACLGFLVPPKLQLIRHVKPLANNAFNMGQPELVLFLDFPGFEMHTILIDNLELKIPCLGPICPCFCLSFKNIYNLHNLHFSKAPCLSFTNMVQQYGGWKHDT